MTSPARTVARLSSPGEMAAAVPHLCGYVPAESLVVLALRGPRSRVGLTLASSLPPPGEAQEQADDLVCRVRAVGADQLYALIYTEEPGLRVRHDLVDALRAACAGHGVGLTEALLVRHDRCWSQLCDNAACCPPEGHAVPASSAALSLLQTETVARGRAVLPSRAALVAMLAPPVLLAQATALQALDEAGRRLAQQVADQGPGPARAELLAAVRQAVQRYACPPADVTPGEAAVLALALHDVQVRDEVMTWALRSRDALLAMLLDVAGRTPAPYDAPVCTCVAWAAYARGDGGLANVALDRALTTDSDYSLALLLRTALDHLVPPQQMRRLLRDTQRVLRS